MARTFDPSELNKLYKPGKLSNGEDNGQVTIVGGSKLFHGAPLLSLKAASRVVDMVFFASPEPSMSAVAEQIKSQLLTFIWVPWEDLDEYIKKSDAVLIGPGFMRAKNERNNQKYELRDVWNKAHIWGKPVLDKDQVAIQTSKITVDLLTRFRHKRFVVDAGSLQVIEARHLPEGSIITPNKKEYEKLFGNKRIEDAARETRTIIVLKGPITYVSDGNYIVEVKGGNAGMTKGGTGDVQAGLTVSLLAKNEPFLAATSAAYLIKKAADELFQKVGTNYNADDLANQIPQTLQYFLK